MNNQINTKNNQQNIVEMNPDQSKQNAMVARETSKAVQEIQASLMVAKHYPRDEIHAEQKILNACRRTGLAEVATFSYARGGTNITGPSIRLAESLAQYWGNIDFGWREVERLRGESVVQAYCWDKETNTRREQTFNVKHIRNTKNGSYPLKDERDIYENNANMAARRLRACILALIPGDIVEGAVLACEATLKTNVQITPDRIKKMLSTFDKEYGVNKKMIEARLQRKIEAITPAQFVDIGKIANSLKDGMSSPEDWFDVSLREDEKGSKNKKATTKKSSEVKKEAKTSSEQLDSFKAEQKELITEDGEVIEEEEDPNEFIMDENGELLSNL